jgi:hypothetical protein
MDTEDEKVFDTYLEEVENGRKTPSDKRRARKVEPDESNQHIKMLKID